MRREPRLSFISLALIAALSVATLPPSVSHATTFRPGELGIVRVIIRGLGERPPNQVIRKARILDPLFDAYLLRTEAKERARVEFADGTQLNLGQRTDAVLQDPHHLLVRSGEVDQVDAKGSVHRITTNVTAIAGIGTNYDVRVRNGRVIITVVQGRVAVSNAGYRVVIAHNQQTTVIGHARPTRVRHVNAQKYIAWVKSLDTEGWTFITPSNATARAFDSVSGLVAVAGHIYAVTNLGVIEFTKSGRKLTSFGPHNLL